MLTMKLKCEFVLKLSGFVFFRSSIGWSFPNLWISCWNFVNMWISCWSLCCCCSWNLVDLWNC